MTEPAPSADAAAAGFTHRQILVIMSGLMAGMLLAALDQTIVATAIRTIADDLHGYALQAWVTTAYLITATLSTPLYGKLSDMYGRRPVLPRRDRHLRRRLGAVHHGAVDVRTRRVPGTAGPRRRWVDVARAHDHGRHRQSPRTRPLPGLLHGRLRDVERRRSRPRRPVRGRRLDRRDRRLALGVPGQRARRAGRIRDRVPRAAPAQRVPRGRPHRLVRGGGDGDRPGAAADRRRAGPRVGLGQPEGLDLLRRRRARSGRVRRDRGAGCARRR